MQNMSLRTYGGLTMQSYFEVCSKGPVIWDWVSINSAAEVCENKVCRAQKIFVRKNGQDRPKFHAPSELGK